MSYLEMVSSPLPDMSSGIISVWFRDPTLSPAPAADTWPVPVPPDAFSYIDAHPFETMFWNAYGMPIPSFGRYILYPALVTLPYPPPFQTDTMHMLLTFGNPNQSYDYCPWNLQYPSVIPYVVYTGSPVPGVGWDPAVWPAPYAPYFYYLYGGDMGKFTVANYRLADAPQSYTDIVPQSFIGVDKDGYIKICLQTKNKADYTGYAYQLDQITNIMATATNLGPAPTGTTPPLQIWPGYWDGYQFKHKDVSNQVMAAAPECFMIGSGGFNINDAGEGPRVFGPGWHHLLFSFQINGAVEEDQLETDVTNNLPYVSHFSTGCKAWLALDDVNYKGSALQKAYPIPMGPFGLPLLPGQGGQLGGVYGTTHVFPRRYFPGLGDNDIVPQNAWLYGGSGTPRSGIVQTYITSAGISNGLAPFGSPAGDFQALNWTGLLATSYYGAAAVIPLNPPRPDIPDPMAYYDPPSYRGGPFVLPTSGFPIGIPAQERHLKHNTGLEMAELQIWANKTLDTNNLQMRRLFLDYPKDEDGNPDTSKPLQPVNPSVAAKVLGEPDILLHGTNNWKAGRNTGLAGFSIDKLGNTVINKAGQFQPVAAIEKFLPDPKLGV
jgi:hypothetical protein